METTEEGFLWGDIVTATKDRATNSSAETSPVPPLRRPRASTIHLDEVARLTVDPVLVATRAVGLEDQPPSGSGENIQSDLENLERDLAEYAEELASEGKDDELGVGSSIVDWSEVGSAAPAKMSNWNAARSAGPRDPEDEDIDSLLSQLDDALAQLIHRSERWVRST